MGVTVGWGGGEEGMGPQPGLERTTSPRGGEHAAPLAMGRLKERARWSHRR